MYFSIILLPKQKVMYTRFFSCGFFALLLSSCSSPKEKIPDMAPLQTPQSKVVIYQLMTRLFGNQKSTNLPYGTIEQNGVGKFNDINGTALKAIKELGVTHVWFTGVIEHGLLTHYDSFGIAKDHPSIIKGRAGSPYAIKDYYDVNPDLAENVPSRMMEFEQLVERTHAAGLKVIIDFIPNHVARKYKSDAKPAGVKDLGETDDLSVSFKATNNFYYLPGQSFKAPVNVSFMAAMAAADQPPFLETPAKVTGNDQFTPEPSINEWYETVKLNYGVDIQQGRKTYFDPIPDTWVKMKDILLFWAGKNVDGFRCDMAEMVPVEFWNWAIPQVKAANQSIVFIAEIYNPNEYRNYISKGQFDYLYDKVQLYDTLRSLINHRSSTRDIATIQSSLSDLNGNMVHFMENHDEQRIASRFFAADPWKAVPAMVVSTLIDKGPIMIYFGQEVGEPSAGAEGFGSDDGRTTLFDYWGVPEYQKWVNGGKFDGGRLTDDQKQLRQFYGDILTFANENKAIANGEYYDLTDHNVQAGYITDRVHAFLRHFEDEKLIVISSFSDSTKHIKLQLPLSVVEKLKLNADEVYMARDLMRSGTEVGFSKDFAFELDIPAFSSYILKVK
jgi:glycosidase